MIREGVIKFNFEHVQGTSCREEDIVDLQHWRDKLRGSSLIGQDLVRYDGLGYGNISKRLEDGTYLITGSQTGHLAKLSPEEYARITGFDPDRNLICSLGMVRPSSETMSHLAIYASKPRVGYVFHVHCPEIWMAAGSLDIPATDLRIAYGTVEMFHEVQKLLSRWDDGRKPILAMGGHPDGLITWGETAEQAGSTLFFFLSRPPNQPGRAIRSILRETS